MLPFDLVSALAVVVGGACLIDVMRRLRLPTGSLPARDWVVNAEVSGASLCVSLVIFDLLAHWAAAHAGGISPGPQGPFVPPTSSVALTLASLAGCSA